MPLMLSAPVASAQLKRKTVYIDDDDEEELIKRMRES
jgi:hypothetical protein